MVNVRDEKTFCESQPIFGSYLTKLGICGVRSFSPERYEQLDLEKPLTLLVGDNGSGKTTIIECIRYAATGAVPPGCDKGHGFLFDPNALDVPEVKGNVKLLFKTCTDKNVLASRSAQTTKIKKKDGIHRLQFKQLENSLKLYVAGTNAVSVITQKCADMDNLIPRLLGVPTPVLDFVLLCHQEESLWPLGDAATLKKRLELLLGSARYIAALSSLDKTRRLIATESREKKGFFTAASVSLNERRKLENRVVDLEGKVVSSQSDLHSKNSQLKKINGSITESDIELAAMRAEHQKFESVIEQRKKMIGLIEEKLKRKEHARNEIADIEKILHNHLNDASDLEQHLGIVGSSPNHGENLTSLVSRRSELETIIKRNQAELNILEVDAAGPKFESIMGRMGYLAENLRHMEADINRIEKSSGHNSLSTLQNELTTLQPKVFDLEKSFADSENRKHILTTEIQEKSNVLKEKLVEIQRLRDETSMKRGKLENELELVAASVNTLRSFAKFSNHSGSSSLGHMDDEGMNSLRESVSCQERLLMDISRMEYQIDSMRRLLQEYEVALNHSSFAERGIGSEYLDIWKCEVRHIQIENSEINVRIAETRYKVDQTVTSLANITKTIANDQVNVMIDHVSNKVLMCGDKTYTVDSIKIQDRESIRKQIQSVTSLLSETTEFMRVLKNRSDITDFDSGRSHVRKFCAISYERGSCVICDHEICRKKTSISEMEKMVESTLETQDKTDSDTMNNLGKNKEELKSCLQDLESILSHITAMDESNRLSEVLSDLRKAHESQVLLKTSKDEEISQLLEKIRKAELANTRRKELAQRIFDSFPEPILGPTNQHCLDLSVSQVLSFSEEFFADVDSLLNFSDSVDRSTENPKRRKRWNDVLSRQVKAKVEDEVDSRAIYTTEGALNLLKSLNDRKCHDSSLAIQNLKRSIESIQTDIHRYDTWVHAREERVPILLIKETELTGAIGELHFNEQSIHSLTKQVCGIETEIGTVQLELSSITSCPLGEQISSEEVLSMKSHLKELKEYQEKWSSLLSLTNKTGIDIRESESLISNLKEWDNKKASLTRKIAESQVDMFNIGKNIETNRIQSEISRICDLVSTLQRKTADLHEEICSLDKDIQTVTVNEDLHEWFDTLSSNIQVTHKEVTRMNTLRDEYLSEIAQIRGRLGRIEEEQADASRSLTGYDSAVDDFSKALLEYEVLSMASVDMQNYHKALDRAMMKYHSEKMKEINMCLRDLWASIYQGEDIDYVYIRTYGDDSSELGTGQDTYDYQGTLGTKNELSLETSRGKNYDYQVMMVSGGVHSALRGRCSAGQKVLVSLIIRLALAESFGSHCGVFALDEPTTNLDGRHAASLALALSRLVQQGGIKSNFQMILITHDEEFVKELCSVNRLCDNYHRLEKDCHGFSTITKCSIANLT